MHDGLNRQCSHCMCLRAKGTSIKAASIAAAVVAFLAFGRPARAAEPPPRVEITNTAVRPGDSLRVWVACAKGTGAADVRSAVIDYPVPLDPQRDGGWWFAKPVVSSKAHPGTYALRSRCTAGPGSPYTYATAPFRVSANAQHWVAASTTAQSITGDVRVTSSSLTFAAGGQLRIRYLRDVPGSVSVLGSSKAGAHAQLYRVLSESDLHLRSGNTLCGKRPTYLTTLRTASALDADIILTIYAAAAEPSASSSDAICASYTYFPNMP